MKPPTAQMPNVGCNVFTHFMRVLLFSNLILILLGCFNSTKLSSTDQRPNTSCSLPNSLFPFNNISSSLVAESFYYDLDNSGYTDSTKRIRLPSLDATQKQQYFELLPPDRRDWIIGDWQMYFVSKQNKVGSLTPIIVSAGGTDFSALILMLLDSSCHQVSNFILSGGECGDNFVACDFKQSFLSGNRINSYVRSIVDRDNLYNADSLLIDSVNYITEILSDGTLETRRTDSVRYKRRSFIK